VQKTQSYSKGTVERKLQLLEKSEKKNNKTETIYMEKNTGGDPS